MPHKEKTNMFMIKLSRVIILKKWKEKNGTGLGNILVLQFYFHELMVSRTWQMYLCGNMHFHNNVFGEQPDQQEYSK